MELCYKEMDLTEWEVINRQQQINKAERTNYKTLLGESLRGMAYIYAGMQIPWKICEEDVLRRILTFTELTPEIKRKVRIGVCAAYSEKGLMEAKQ